LAEVEAVRPGSGAPGGSSRPSRRCRSRLDLDQQRELVPAQPNDLENGWLAQCHVRLTAGRRGA
jgi:hypothetical protein